MARIDFNKLRTVVSDPQSGRNVRNSNKCYPEYTSLVSNYVVKHNDFTEKESALHIMSMQNWIDKKTTTACQGTPKVGQIWLTDLGSNYMPECSYVHPAVILEIIGNMVYVVPTTSSPQTVSTAFHPTAKPGGNPYFRKVERSDGFASTCALILSNARSISAGRLIAHKGDLPDITTPNSLFKELKEKCFKFAFPKQHIELIKATGQLTTLTEEKEQLTEDNTKLTEEKEILELEKNKLLERIAELEKEVEENKRS